MLGKEESLGPSRHVSIHAVEVAVCTGAHLAFPSGLMLWDLEGRGVIRSVLGELVGLLLEVRLEIFGRDRCDLPT
jgi:hypothetical protein